MVKSQGGERHGKGSINESCEGWGDEGNRTVVNVENAEGIETEYSRVTRDKGEGDLLTDHLVPGRETA